MIPDNRLSTSAVYGSLIGGRSYPVNKNRDFEWGGIYIQDPSEGLMYQVWEAVLRDDNVLLKSETTPEFIAYTGANITEISFTFDQNMNFTLAFVQDGIAKLYWYDSAVSGFTTTSFGTSVISPKVSLDDKRPTQSAISDVIFTYVKNGNLYYRQQRDRFTVEYLLDGRGVINRIKKFGMNNKLRLQWQVE